jgi:hypothetical protein
MDDVELRETVESILGQGIRMLDVEKKTTFKSEEVLLINGVAVPLVGADGDIIRQALLSGQVPPSDVLNSLLISAGIWRHPVRLQTELTVKQTTLNRDAITVSRNGRVVDERLKETKEEDLLRKTSTEVWRAVAGPDSTTDKRNLFQPDPRASSIPPEPTPPTPRPPTPKEEDEKSAEEIPIVQFPSDVDTADEETTSPSPTVRTSNCTQTVRHTPTQHLLMNSFFVTDVEGLSGSISHVRRQRLDYPKSYTTAAANKNPRKMDGSWELVGGESFLSIGAAEPSCIRMEKIVTHCR